MLMTGQAADALTTRLESHRLEAWLGQAAYESGVRAARVAQLPASEFLHQLERLTAAWGARSHAAAGTAGAIPGKLP